MEAPGTVPNSTICPTCGKEIILAGREGLTHMDCPHCGAPTVVPVEFKGFVLLNALGFGGMGTVYKAMDMALNRMLAIKILRKKLAASSQFMENFRCEAQAAAAVNHPNVARVFSFGEHEGQCYLVMELLERGSLDDRLTKIGKVTEKEVLDIGIQIAGGLKAAYDNGLLHRDVKPGNILFNEQGIPKIVDFGLARPKDNNHPTGEPEAIWGTPYYIAPEKLLGHPEDARSDIYSLGATLFHAFTGRPPFDAASAADVAVKHTTTPAYSLKTFVPTAQDATAQVIGRMLAKNPNERYATYDELIVALEHAKLVLEENDKKPVIITQTGERVSIVSFIGTMTGLVLLIAAGVFLWVKRDVLFNEQPPPPPPPPTKVFTQKVERTTIKIEDVSFNEDLPGGPLWHKAAKDLANGRMAAALTDYRKIENHFLSQPNHLRWLFYAKGVTFLLDSQFISASNAFVQAEDPLLEPRVPSRITPINFVSPLSSVMLRKLPQPEMDSATPIPPWAAALNHFNAGLLELRDRRYTNAVARLNRYAAATPHDEHKWVYAFQPLAAELARECLFVPQTIAKAESLHEDGKTDLAFSALQDMQTNLRIPLLRGRLQLAADNLRKRVEETNRQQEQERIAAQKRAAEERERIRLEEKRRQLALHRERTDADARLTAEAEAAAKKLWAAYDFAGLVARCDALASRLQTDEARAQLAQTAARARILHELKHQLAAAFAKLPMDGGAIQQPGASFIGKLARASDSHLVFVLDYGETPREWRELSPATFVNIAASYARGDTPERAALWYMRLAVFCRQYGLAALAESYAKEAVKLQPSLDAELKKTGAR